MPTGIIERATCTKNTAFILHDSSAPGAFVLYAAIGRRVRGALEACSTCAWEERGVYVLIGAGVDVCSRLCVDVRVDITLFTKVFTPFEFYLIFIICYLS